LPKFQNNVDPKVRIADLLLICTTDLFQKKSADLYNLVCSERKNIVHEVEREGHKEHTYRSELLFSSSLLAENI
jgi:hypothetical protein